MRVPWAPLVFAAALGATGCGHRTAQTTATPSAPTATARAVTPLASATPSAAPATPAPHPSPAPPAPSVATLPTPFVLQPFLVPRQRLRVAPQRLSFLIPETPQTVPPITLSTTAPVPDRAPDAPPEIVSVDLPVSSVSVGETVVGSVIASSNTASVVVSVARYAVGMEKIGPGRFTIAVTVPHIPFFLRHRTYTLYITARNSRGDATVQALPITVR